MKTSLILLFCMILTFVVPAQEISKELKEIDVTPPEFTGVSNIQKIMVTEKSDLLHQYLIENFVFPGEDIYKYKGTEVVQFTVTANGKLTNFKVVNSLARDIDEEFIRVLKTTEGMWKPGYNNGDPVAMEKEVALTIKTGFSESSAHNQDFTEEAEELFVSGNENFFNKGKLRKALKSYDEGIRLLPYDQGLYLMRGLCRYELGYIEGARQDWIRCKDLGGSDMTSTLVNYDVEHLKGYEELYTMFIKTK